jgi:hypothetical protein
MMTGRLAAADSVTSITGITGRQPPATMIIAIHRPAAPVCEGGRLSRAVGERLLQLLHDPVDHDGQQAAGGCQK